MIRPLVLLAPSVLALAVTATAQTTITFRGTIDYVGSDVADRPAWRCARVGDPFVVTYTFDETAPPTNVLDAHRSVYGGVALAVTVRVGDAVATEFDDSSVFVADDDQPVSGLCIDALTFSASNPLGHGKYRFLTLELGAQAIAAQPCPSAVTAPTLPSAIDLGQFTNTRSFWLRQDDSGNQYMTGVVTAVSLAPFNDDCANAADLPPDFAVTPFYAVGATTDGLDASGSCDYGPFGSEQNHNDVWFHYTPNVGGTTYISTLGLAGYDTRLTVYDASSCPDSPLDIIACNDDEAFSAPFEAGLDVNLVAGTTYTIRLGTYDAGISAGTGSLRIAQGPGVGAPPAAPASCTTRQVPLSFNFNGIVHELEGGAPDDPTGFRSISDRALDFRAGVPSDALLDAYRLETSPFNLDLVHLGNRDTAVGGLFAFDASTDGDAVGIKPFWLPSVDQTGPQSTSWFPAIPLGPNCEVSLLLMGTDGGTTVDVNLHLESGIDFNYAVSAPDWFGGTYPGTQNVDNADPGPPLRITEHTMVLPFSNEDLVGVSFTNLTPMDGSAAILAMNVDTGDATRPVNDDCANAIALPSTYADTTFHPRNATTDGTDAAGFCDYGVFGDEQNHNDVWFTYTPDVGGCTYVSTLGLAGYNTRLTVYDSPACPDDPANIIACADWELHPIDQPYEAGLDVVLTQGQTYLIRVGTPANGWVLASPVLRIAAGPGAAVNSGGANPGAPGCDDFLSLCNGDRGDQMGCSDCPCFNHTATGTVGGCRNSAGTPARLLGSGDKSISLPSGSTTDLRFGLEGAPPSSFCILNSGDAVAPQGMSNPCFGLNSGAQSASYDGLRCAVQNTRRHGGRSADVNGDVGVTNNPWGGEGGPPAGIAGAAPGFSAGQTRYFQVINRDDPMLGCGRGLNTSQAVRVTFEP